MSRYRNPDSELNIRRIDAPKNHGFQVHFERDEETYTKQFGDSVNGGKEGARTNARAFRDELASHLGPPKSTESPIRFKCRTSRLGKVGYCFRERKNKDGTTTQYISVSARFAKGKAKNTQIRVENGDIPAALAKAEVWREDVIQIRVESEKKNG
jgi:hypothetical protein